MKGKPSNLCSGSYGTISLSLACLNDVGHYHATCSLCRRFLALRGKRRVGTTYGVFPRHNAKGGAA